MFGLRQIIDELYFIFFYLLTDKMVLHINVVASPICLDSLQVLRHVIDVNLSWLILWIMHLSY